MCFFLFFFFFFFSVPVFKKEILEIFHDFPR